MSKTVLCDTNVWLDYYLGLRPNHDSARRLIRDGIYQDVLFLVPVSALGDFFYLCQADFKKALRDAYGTIDESQAVAAREGAWAALANLLETATVVGADHSDAYKALKQKVAHGDYEDNLVVAAALRSGADFLVTDDEKLRRDAPIMALTVNEACEYLGLR